MAKKQLDKALEDHKEEKSNYANWDEVREDLFANIMLCISMIRVKLISMKNILLSIITLLIAITSIGQNRLESVEEFYGEYYNSSKKQLITLRSPSTENHIFDVTYDWMGQLARTKGYVIYDDISNEYLFIIKYHGDDVFYPLKLEHKNDMRIIILSHENKKYEFKCSKK